MLGFDTDGMVNNFFLNYAPPFVLYYEERNKQMTIKQQFDKYIIIYKLFFPLVIFLFFLYTHNVLVGNYQGKIYLKYLDIKGRIILKRIF